MDDAQIVQAAHELRGQPARPVRRRICRPEGWPLSRVSCRTAPASGWGRGRGGGRNMLPMASTRTVRPAASQWANTEAVAAALVHVGLLLRQAADTALGGGADLGHGHQQVPQPLAVNPLVGLGWHGEPRCGVRRWSLRAGSGRCAVMWLLRGGHLAQRAASCKVTSGMQRSGEQWLGRAMIAGMVLMWPACR